MQNEEYLTTPAKKLPKGKRSFNEFIYTEVFKTNDIPIPDFLYKLSTLWKTEKFNSFLKFFQTVEDLDFKNENFSFVSAYYRKCLYVCPGCGKLGLTKYCSQKCSNNDPEVKEKKAKTSLEHYGVDNPAKSKTVKEKSIQTCLEKYKKEYAFQAETVKEKIRETSLERYGVEHPMKSESVKARQKSVILERYGVEYPMQSPEAKEKSKETCLQKYGADNISRSEYFQELMFRQNFEKFHKHIEDFTSEFVRGRFVENFHFKIKEFSEYFNIGSRVVANRFKKKLGITEQNDDNLELGYSQAEKELYDSINVSNKLHNIRSVIPPLELDIFLPDYNLGIEYNGVHYHSEQFKPKGYHIFKTKECEKKGIQLLQIFDFEDPDIWRSVISGKIGQNTRIFARKCTLREISALECEMFLKENHLQGSCPAKYRYGLFYGNDLVQVMTFGKPRFNKGFDFELLRLASKKYVTVVGGASRLLKHFRESHQGSIISYCNRRFSKGDVYRKLGFALTGVTDVGYFWCKNDTVLSRYQCQKHLLKDLLETFDPLKSESENLKASGYFRVYDCGNLVFSLE